MVLPLCKGIYAFVTNDFQTACDFMTPCISRRTEIGGSDAQSEILAQIYLLCLLQTNKKKQLKSILTFICGITKERL